MAKQSVIKIVDDLKKFIDNRIKSVQNSLNYKLSNIRIGEDNIVANAVTAKSIATEAIDTYHIRTNAIQSKHLSLDVTTSLSYPNRNYIKNSDYNVLSSNYLIHEYETSELIHDLDYTIVVYGLVNPGQQIMVKFNDGADGTDAAFFDSNGYAVIHTHTPGILQNESVGFYNYPEPTATIASIGWACMYRGNIASPSMELNLAPEDLGQKVSDATTSIKMLGGEINAKLTEGDLTEILRWKTGEGIVLGRVSSNPEDTAIDMQLLNSVMNIRRDGVPVVWFGINGMSVTEGRVESSMGYGVYSQRVTADGGLAIG